MRHVLALLALLPFALASHNGNHNGNENENDFNLETQSNYNPIFHLLGAFLRVFVETVSAILAWGSEHVSAHLTRHLDNTAGAELPCERSDLIVALRKSAANVAALTMPSHPPEPINPARKYLKLGSFFGGLPEEVSLIICQFFMNPIPRQHRNLKIRPQSLLKLIVIGCTTLPGRFGLERFWATPSIESIYWLLKMMPILRPLIGTARLSEFTQCLVPVSGDIAIEMGAVFSADNHRPHIILLQRALASFLNNTGSNQQTEMLLSTLKALPRPVSSALVERTPFVSLNNVNFIYSLASLKRDYDCSKIIFTHLCLWNDDITHWNTIFEAYKEMETKYLKQPTAETRCRYFLNSAVSAPNSGRTRARIFDRNIQAINSLAVPSSTALLLLTVNAARFGAKQDICAGTITEVAKAVKNAAASDPGCSFCNWIEIFWLRSDLCERWANLAEEIKIDGNSNVRDRLALIKLMCNPKRFENVTAFREIPQSFRAQGFWNRLHGMTPSPMRSAFIDALVQCLAGLSLEHCPDWRGELAKVMLAYGHRLAYAHSTSQEAAAVLRDHLIKITGLSIVSFKITYNYANWRDAQCRKKRCLELFLKLLTAKPTLSMIDRCPVIGAEYLLPPSGDPISVLGYMKQVPWVAVGIEMLRMKASAAEIERALRILDNVPESSTDYQDHMELISLLIVDYY